MLKVILFCLLISCGVQVDRNTTRIAKSTENLDSTSQELTQLFEEFITLFKEVNLSLKDLASFVEFKDDLKFLLTEFRSYLDDMKEEEETESDDEYIEPDFEEEA